MSKRGKVTAEERIEAVKACVEGEMSQAEAARQLGVDESAVREWVKRYKVGGTLAFKEQEHNAIYTEELKATAVNAYLDGKLGLREVSAKYGLRSWLHKKRLTTAAVSREKFYIISLSLLTGSSSDRTGAF